MISWLLEQTIFFSITAVFLVTLRHPLRVIVGAKSFYFLWAIIPIQLIASIFMSRVHIPVYLQQNNYVANATYVIHKTDEVISDVSSFAPQVWLVGGLLCAFLIWRQHYRFITELKRSELDVDDPFIEELVLTHKSPISKIRFKQSEEVQSPILLGLFSTTIILPVNFSEIEKNKKRLILEHEFVHVQRADLFWNFMGLTILCLFWFNPIAWWAYRHFRHAQEIACDVQVLANENKATRLLYAKTFLEQSMKPNQYLLSTLHYGGKHNIRERLSNIKNGVTYSWRALPIASILIFGSIGFQVIAANDYKNLKENAVTPIMRVEPIYPSFAVSNGLEGIVTLSYDIDKDGSVSNVKVVKSDPKGLFDANAILALQQWTYSTPKQKLQHQLVALEFVLSNNHEVIESSNIETIQIEGI